MNRNLFLLVIAAIVFAPMAVAAQIYPPQPQQPPLQSEPAPDESPTPDPNRKGLDGVWEVQIQHTDGTTTYDHFKLTQNGNTIAGTFLDNQHNNKKYPVTGSLDAKSIHLVVTRDDGTTMVFTGSVDGTTDMVGMLTDGAQQIAFTAAYRPKYKFIDTISPLPGGIGGGTGAPPSGTPP
ncbi:MAG: hypothetical protein JO177_04390 [Candidatus Eremiobacteraeota bacterium]|nr:hypothetical protein [Candidatus Eremiobacteraeota bacterium]